MQGQRVGLYDTEFGTAVSAVANAGVFAALILGLAWTLHRTDAERRSAEEERVAV